MKCSYKFTIICITFRFSMFQEPLLLIGAYFIFFLLAIIYVRLDFAITKDEGADSKLKAAGICEKIISHQVRNFNLVAFFHLIFKYFMYDNNILDESYSESHFIRRCDCKIQDLKRHQRFSSKFMLLHKPILIWS